MTRTVSLAILIGVLTIITMSASADDDIIASDLWYPGGIGSYWKYELAQSQEATATFTKNVDENGKSYSLIEETQWFFGILEPETEGYDPFLTFRKEGTSRIWGYGKVANKVLAGILMETLIPGLAEIGIAEDIIDIQMLYDEWLLLETLNIGHEWTVMRLEATSEWGINGPFSIEARLHDIQSVQTKAGKFDAFPVEYFMKFSIFDEFGRRTANETFPLFVAWLAPNIGLVQAAVDDELFGRLIEYHIEGAVIPAEPLPNQPPIASFVFIPENPTANEEITFDASGSYDPDGQIASYEWDFGDGATASGQVAKHPYSSSEVYAVTLEVTDNAGETASEVMKITVVPAEPPPEAVFYYEPFSPETGDWVTFSGGLSGSLDNRIVLYEWDWENDGTFQYASTDSKTTYYWNESGTYQVTLRVTGKNGLVGKITKSITVKKEPFKERFWKWMPWAEDGISEEDLKRIKSRLNICNYPSRCNQSDMAFSLYTDADLRMALGKDIANDAPGYTYGMHILNAFYEVDMIENIWTYKSNTQGTKFFSMMAEINSGWSSTATNVVQNIIIGSFKGGLKSAGASTLFLALDAIQISSSIKAIEKRFGHQALFMYLVDRVNLKTDHATAWRSGTFHPTTTPEKLKIIEDYFQRLGDTYTEALSKDELWKLRNELKKEFRAVLLSVLEKAKPELLGYSIVTANSPIELRVYDTNGNVTGLIQGEIMEEIPFSFYDEETETVVIFNSSDSYRYEILGTEEGEYGLDVTSVQQGEATTFTAINIPVSVDAIHKYSVDWDVLKNNGEGITIQIDDNGDGVPEYTIVSDSELTAEEYSSVTGVTPYDRQVITWGEVRQTKLLQNFPNPFNPETWIPYQLAEQSETTIRIFNATGELIRRLDLGRKPAGFYLNREQAAYWDGLSDSGEQVASGVYFYTFQAGGFTEIKKMVITR